MSHHIEVGNNPLSPDVSQGEIFQPFLLETLTRGEIRKALGFYGDNYQRGMTLDEVFNSMSNEEERNKSKLAIKVLSKHFPRNLWLRQYYKFNIVKTGPSDDDIRVEPVALEF